MPGTDSGEATIVIAGELVDLPHIPELPARGPGADMIGRTSALLAEVSSDFCLETSPTGWRLAGAPTAEMARASEWLAADLDRAHEIFSGSPGWYKIQAAGPWTLAAGIETRRGHRLLLDSGLTMDVAAVSAEALARHATDVRARLPGRRLVFQIDEPALPAVLAGRLPTSSGWGHHPAVPASEAAAVLRQVREAVDAVDAVTLLHCCDAFPFQVARTAGFPGLSFDLGVEGDSEDAVAEAWESGIALVVGAVPIAPPGTGGSAAEAAWSLVSGLWRRAGLAEAGLATLSFSPACGLAGVSAAQARAALDACQQLVRRAAQHY